MDFNTVLSDIIKALVPIAITVIGAYATRLVQVIGHSKKLTFLKELAAQAVQQAEEEGHTLGFTSPQKLDSAVDFVVGFAAAHHVKVTDAEATALVLSAVTELHQVQQAMGSYEPPAAPLPDVPFTPYNAETPAPTEVSQPAAEATSGVSGHPAEGAQGSDGATPTDLPA